MTTSAEKANTRSPPNAAIDNPRGEPLQKWRVTARDLLLLTTFCCVMLGLFRGMAAALAIRNGWLFLICSLGAWISCGGTLGAIVWRLRFGTRVRLIEGFWRGVFFVLFLPSILFGICFVHYLVQVFIAH